MMTPNPDDHEAARVALDAALAGSPLALKVVSAARRASGEKIHTRVRIDLRTPAALHKTIQRALRQPFFYWAAAELIQTDFDAASKITSQHVLLPSVFPLFTLVDPVSLTVAAMQRDRSYLSAYLRYVAARGESVDDAALAVGRRAPHKFLLARTPHAGVEARVALEALATPSYVAHTYAEHVLRGVLDGRLSDAAPIRAALMTGMIEPLREHPHGLRARRDLAAALVILGEPCDHEEGRLLGNALRLLKRPADRARLVEELARGLLTSFDPATQLIRHALKLARPLRDADPADLDALLALNVEALPLPEPLRRVLGAPFCRPCRLRGRVGQETRPSKFEAPAVEPITLCGCGVPYAIHRETVQEDADPYDIFGGGDTIDVTVTRYERLRPSDPRFPDAIDRDVLRAWFLPQREHVDPSVSRDANWWFE